MSIILSAPKKWGLLREAGMLWTEWGWGQGPSTVWVEQSDAREMLIFSIKHWGWGKLQRAGLCDPQVACNASFLWTGNLFAERIAWFQNRGDDIVPLSGQNHDCSLLYCLLRETIKEFPVLPWESLHHHLLCWCSGKTKTQSWSPSVYRLPCRNGNGGEGAGSDLTALNRGD